MKAKPATLRAGTTIDLAESLGYGAPLDWHKTRTGKVREAGPLSSWGLVFSVALHLLAIVLLAIRPAASTGIPVPQPQNVMAIYLDSQFDSEQAATPSVEKPVPRQEDKKAEPVEKVTISHDPKADIVKPAPPKKKETTSQSRPKESASSTRKTSVATPEQKLGNEGESAGTSLLGRVRENWLRPKNSLSLFRCRIRIDYLAGGIVSNVTVLQGCGNDSVDDSVMRAIWKSQPLPLGPSANGPGSMVLEFTP